jgi:hypothetical protein
VSYSVIYTNLSQQTLTRDWMAMPDAPERNEGATPTDTLEAAGATTQAYDLNDLGDFFNKSFDFGVVWRCPNGWRFGILVRVPAQTGPFGKGPFYHVMTDNNPTKGADPQWTPMGASDPYRWDASQLGIVVNAQSDADHTSINITVDIADPAPSGTTAPPA